MISQDTKHDSFDAIQCPHVLMKQARSGLLCFLAVTTHLPFSIQNFRCDEVSTEDYGAVSTIITFAACYTQNCVEIVNDTQDETLILISL